MATPLHPFRTVSDFSVRRAGIIIKKDHEPADAFADMLCDWLKGKGITATINQIEPDIDILIILGGDGTLLHVADQAARHSIPVIGINLGNLGFLTELTEQEALPALEEIISGAVTVENRPDWCISRQRDWGVPIAFFRVKETGEVILDEKTLNFIAMIYICYRTSLKHKLGKLRGKFSYVRE